METATSFTESPLLWVFSNFLSSFPNVFAALTQPTLWLDWVSWEKTTEDKQSLMRFIYYGASIELFFALSIILIFYTLIAVFYRPLMWKTVTSLETLANTTGRFFSWAGLTMVLIQIVIIFIQRIFAVSEITIGFGLAFSFDVSWWSESLKLYNAMIVALCVTYTFVQGGHVRVDLVYSVVSYRTKRVIDMFGSIFFMLPAAILLWMYS